MVNICTKFIQGIWPRQCLLCLKTGNHPGLCEACQHDLPLNLAACRRCASPLPAGFADSICGQCLRSPPVFHDAHVPLLYARPVDYMIRQIKFHHDLASARFLGGLLADSIAHRIEQAGTFSQPDILLPVPLHRQRLRQRGYNQAVELARPIAKFLDVPIDLACCQRHLATQTQSDLPLAQRYANVKNAFTVSSAIEAGHIAIIDDVMTSGQTVSSLARELLKHGVKHVSVWCVARTVYQG